MKYFFTVKDFEGELAFFLAQSGVSSRQITRLRKKAGLVKLNGKTVFTNAKVKIGDFVEILVEEKKQKAVPVCEVLPDIIYEDDHFCVINKPAGMATIATRKHYGTSLQNALATIWGEHFVFHPVNRLDKDTSGLMIVAKNSYVHNLFDKMLRQNEIKKTYLAIIDGKIEKSGEINCPILDVEGEIKRVVSSQGKEAVTKFEVEQIFGDKTFVKINLLTGRTHQIRVHFSHIGYPLVGDEIYGKTSTSIDRHALHASKLDFFHPVTGEKMAFEANLPDDMKKLLTKE